MHAKCFSYVNFATGGWQPSAVAEMAIQDWVQLQRGCSTPQYWLPRWRFFETHSPSHVPCRDVSLIRPFSPRKSYTDTAIAPKVLFGTFSFQKGILQAHMHLRRGQFQDLHMRMLSQSTIPIPNTDSAMQVCSIWRPIATLQQKAGL